jgi:hypothetical protein
MMPGICRRLSVGAGDGSARRQVELAAHIVSMSETSLRELG